MKKITKFPEGGKIEIKDEGIFITSKDGDVSTFNFEGKLLKVKKSKNAKPKWFKYFFFMGKAEREVVKNWYENQVAKTEKQKSFLEELDMALKVVDYDYRIATIEPSKSKEGKIFYEEGKNVYRGIDCYEWELKVVKFSAKYGSAIATLYELYLWYAYRIAKGFWTIEYVCDDSSKAGNYWNSPNAKRDYEPSGARTVGGFADGVGNTYKIIRHANNFILCGGYVVTDGNVCPVADAILDSYPKTTRSNGTPVVVLKGKNIL